MPDINIQSCDGWIYTVDIQVVKCSGTIKAMVAACRSLLDRNSAVPLAKVNAATLFLVLSWAKHHRNDPENSTDYMNGYICPWDAEFVNVDYGTLIDLILAARYLEIQGLFHLICLTVANMIRAKAMNDNRNSIDNE
ncbi:hypothetical protein KR018_002233 [Drosophila ironensis]|nr:hypothetical protein KR018_002233 [Drosophila ironensis]